ncbi:MAG: PAS domain-containing protein [Ferrovibrio sp.]|uniref:PAS domain-containing protein n=1 Tax=Ferrovibrio sp. TaxID=1917215 RepID=UPI002634BC99|nr:PAS domain-containing protein [Ferrovibrio sp.]MCW0232337.1 PAS domain-containing protein [Ferrovibrio sp.]
MDPLVRLSPTGLCADPFAPADSEGVPPGLRPEIDDLTDPLLRQALGWWRDLAGPGGTLPDRSRIEPAAIKALLPNTILWDASEDRSGGLQFRCRLAGTMLVEVLGQEPTGRWLHQMFGAETACMHRELGAVVRKRRPYFSEHKMSWADKPYYSYIRLMLPFTHHARHLPGDDPQRVALLCNVVSFVKA